MSELILAEINQRLASIEGILQTMQSNNKGYLPEDVIGINEVAKILHISTNTIYQKTSRKLIPHKKEGKFLLFSRKEINHYINDNQVKTHQQTVDDSLIRKRKIS